MTSVRRLGWRGRGQSSRPRRRGKSIALVCLAAVVAAASVWAVARDQTDGGEFAAMISELRGLVTENGLHHRPGRTTDGDPSWQASAYGLGLLHVAGREQVLPAPGQLTQAAVDAVEVDPLWEAWHIVQVERATGTTVPGDWATLSLDKLELPDDPVARIAAVAAAAEVAIARSLPLSEETSDGFRAAISSARRSAESWFAQCRAYDAALALGLSTDSWRPTNLSTPSLEADSTEAVMEIYGWLCVANYEGRTVGSDTAEPILAVLRPHLGSDVAGAEFELYFVGSAWLLAGGELEMLGPMLDRIEERVDPSTGMLPESIILLGSLQNTYYAVQLASMADAVEQVVTPRTVEAVREHAAVARGQGNHVEMLVAAVTLRLAGDQYPELEEAAVRAAERHLRAGVSRENVVSATHTVNMLQQLGRTPPSFEGETFDVQDREERYLAWTMLGLRPYLANADQVQSEFAEVATQAAEALANPDRLMVKEVAAAVRLGVVDRNALPPRLVSWSGRLAGCDGYRTLYRPLLTESICTLDATVAMYAAGLTRLDDRSAVATAGS